MRSPLTVETLSPAHAHAIDAIRRRSGHDTSSHAFNTLYIWRNFVGKQLHLEAELFSLRYEAKGPNTWLFPCGEEMDISAIGIQMIRKKVKTFFYRQYQGFNTLVIKV